MDKLIESYTLAQLHELAFDMDMLLENAYECTGVTPGFVAELRQVINRRLIFLSNDPQ